MNLKLLLIISIGIATCASCNKTVYTPTPPEPTVVDSEAIRKEYYLNNKTALFVLYDGEEHIADSALFWVKDHEPGISNSDHFIVHFDHGHDFDFWGCMYITVDKIEEHVGTPHIIGEYRQQCDSLEFVDLIQSNYMTITQVSDSFISGYFDCGIRYGAFNNVPILR
jgi:hypothetical protein